MTSLKGIIEKLMVDYRANEDEMSQIEILKNRRIKTYMQKLEKNFIQLNDWIKRGVK